MPSAPTQQKLMELVVRKANTELARRRQDKEVGAREPESVKGVVEAALTFSNSLEKRIVCRRVDDSSVEILLSHARGITITEL